MKTISDLSYDPSVSLGQRFAHYIIDTIIFYILFILFAGMAGVIIGLFDAVSVFENETAFTISTYLFIYGLFWGYYTVTEFVFGGTFGKLILGNVVVAGDVEKVSFKKAALRSVIRFVPFEPFSFLGSNRRGWHDQWAKTWVVKKKELDVIRQRLSDRFSDISEFGEKEEDVNFEKQEGQRPSQNPA